ncbi:MAG: DUF2752 domain-containing protein [Clostridia bacterium]|nr:DUF2752 domain-containing protein [Clostridia bacterium]
MYSKKQQWIIFCTVNAVLVAGILLFPLYLKIAKVVPIGECTLLRVFHIYCMGCGVTRALKALLHFDILGSLMYNPIVPVGLFFLALYEGAMIYGLVRGKPRDTYLKTKLVVTIVVLWGIYAIVRNVLVFFGIDLLGDVLG